MIGKDLVKKQLGKVIGNGRSTKVWSDPWLSVSEPIQPIGPPTREVENMLVSDLFKPNSMEWVQKIPMSGLVQLLVATRQSPAIMLQMRHSYHQHMPSESTKVAGLGWLFRDHEDRTLSQGSMITSNISSPLIAKAITVREALIHGKALGLRSLRFTIPHQSDQYEESEARTFRHPLRHQSALNRSLHFFL
ncbi:unnamed protein product [Arabis nemorensis]|uniref:RNase H type-1 domain-containing protein n=1 Tax=Arabis nemorensis TaxID=586526 RepID=A0A565BCM8_9BRAS|nr:unnamed protein product [Arabis nemorensis]